MKKLILALLNLIFIAVFLFGFFSLCRFSFRWGEGLIKDNWHFLPISIFCFIVAFLISKLSDKIENKIQEEELEEDRE